MSEQRDELALEIFIADNSGQSREASIKDWEAYGFGNDATYAHNIADGLLAAGYPKPRTITTVEELDALPVGSVVHSSGHVVWEKLARAEKWARSGQDFLGYARAIALPATVLYEPTP